MYTHEIKVRVRYAETDKMGFVYYGNYATYFEVARVEMLRSLGISYKDLEDEGTLLPVVNFSINYKSPAHYDDELVIKTTIDSEPSAKIRFEYSVLKNDKELASAETTLVFVNSKTMRPTRCPDKLAELFKKYFN